MSSLKCHIFHSKTVVYTCNCKLHSINDEQLYIVCSLILLMLTMLPSLSDQFQADSVLQSMSVLLYWLKVIVHKTPKRGYR